jgi:hypothetical protein
VDTTLDAVLPAQHNTTNIGAIFLSELLKTSLKEYFLIIGIIP